MSWIYPEEFDIQAWPVGSYEVEVYLEGERIVSLPFTVAPDPEDTLVTESVMKMYGKDFLM
jgi:hypothetical protein